MAFHNVRLLEDVERGAQGGPMFKTAILTVFSGFERSNVDWDRARGRWDIGYGLNKKTFLEDVLAFFYAREGRGHTFRFKDWTDYTIGVDSTDTPQEIAIGDGIERTFQAVRRYTSGPTTFDREVTRLVDGTVRPFISGVEQTDEGVGYAVDIETGRITFETPPTASFSVGLICEFDVPVRFDSDRLNLQAVRDDIYSIPEAPLIEVRERLVTDDVEISLPWDLSNAAFVQNFDVGTEDTAPFGLAFKSDGAKMYVLGGGLMNVYEYDLSIAWDISSAAFLQSKSVSAQDTNPRSIDFKPDGTKMYMAGSSNDRVYEYDLSTAWDITTASFLQSKLISAEDLTPVGIIFKSDGTKMLMSGAVGQRVYEYTLSVAWDITTASFIQSFQVSVDDNAPREIAAKTDGTKVFLVGNQNDVVLEYALSVPWDVSTMSFTQSHSVSAQDTAPFGLAFKTNGTRFYITGTNADDVFEYEL